MIYVPACAICGEPAPDRHRWHCRGWGITGEGEVRVCRLDLVPRGGPGRDALLPHPGDHRDGDWSWRTGEEPTRAEPPPPRRAGLDDLPALCAELAALASALDAARSLRPRPDRSQVRRVLGPGLPLDLDALAAAEELHMTVATLVRDLRRAHGHVTGYDRLHDGLATLPALAEALPEGHPLRRRTPVLLAAVRDRARRHLRWDADWLPLGECPGRFDEPVDVVTRSGEVDGDHGCWTPDRPATAAAAMRGEDVTIWRRSMLGVPRDVDVNTVTITCRACGYSCTPEDRAADIVLASGQDLIVTGRQAAHLLAVPENTVYTWARRGVIHPDTSGDNATARHPRYSLAAIAQVVVERRKAPAA